MNVYLVRSPDYKYFIVNDWTTGMEDHFEALLTPKKGIPEDDDPFTFSESKLHDDDISIGDGIWLTKHSPDGVYAIPL